MKKIINILLVLTIVFYNIQLNAQNHPNHPNPPYNRGHNQGNSKQTHNPPTPHHPNNNPLPPVPPVPPPPPPLPPIRQEFNNSGMSMNLGNLPMHGINISANQGAMAENSSIEVKKLNIDATINEIRNNSNTHRFIAVSSLYEIKTTGMNQYAALPIKYAIMANHNVPNGSSLFILAKLGNDTYFIPTKTTISYGMVIAEVNSCAIYDKIALIADTSFSWNTLNSFMISANTTANETASNPHYSTLSQDDGFYISAHIFPKNGRNANFNTQTLTIIQPRTSVSLNIYKNYNNEKIFVQSIPFTSANSYSFCKIDLKNFEQYYDNNSFSYVLWLGFENTNIEDIPNALIFRSNCYDNEGVCYSTEDQLVYIALPENGYQSPFSGGNGTSSNPYIITSVSQLDKIRDYKRRYFKLGCDLDLRSYQSQNWLALGDDETPFNGLFDGNSKTIRNFSINAPEENYQGLFGCIKNGSVKNVKIELSPEGIVCDNYAGALAGYCSNARIYQCYSTGSIKANNYIGGLIGYCSNNTTIRKSISYFNTNSAVENITIGGLVGYAENSVITDCHTNASITASGNKTSIGGIVAQGEQIKIQNCYSTGLLKTNKSGYAGGISGYLNNSETKGCIALQSRICGDNQGRLTGKSINSSYIRCYAWEYIRDINNKYYSEGGFNGIEGNKDSRNGESIAKNSFYGSNTRNKFWTVNKKIGFNLNSWVFNSGYNLPQLRGMPSIANPDYLR